MRKWNTWQSYWVPTGDRLKISQGRLTEKYCDLAPFVLFMRLLQVPVTVPSCA